MVKPVLNDGHVVQVQEMTGCMLDAELERGGGGGGGGFGGGGGGGGEKEKN